MQTKDKNSIIFIRIIINVEFEWKTRSNSILYADVTNKFLYRLEKIHKIFGEFSIDVLCIQVQT